MTNLPVLLTLCLAAATFSGWLQWSWYRGYFWRFSQKRVEKLLAPLLKDKEKLFERGLIKITEFKVVPATILAGAFLLVFAILLFSLLPNGHFLLGLWVGVSYLLGWGITSLFQGIFARTPNGISTEKWVRTQLSALALSKMEAEFGLEEVIEFVKAKKSTGLVQAFLFAFAGKNHPLVQQSISFYTAQLPEFLQNHLLQTHPDLIDLQEPKLMEPFLKSYFPEIRFQALKKLKALDLDRNDALIKRLRSDTDSRVRHLALAWGHGEEPEDFLGYINEVWKDDVAVRDRWKAVFADLPEAPEAVASWIAALLSRAGKDAHLKTGLANVTVAYRGDLHGLMLELAEWKEPALVDIWVELLEGSGQEWGKVAYAALLKQAVLPAKEFEYFAPDIPPGLALHLIKLAPKIENEFGLQVLEPLFSSEEAIVRREAYRVLPNFRFSEHAQIWAKKALKTYNPFLEAAAVSLISNWPGMKGLELLKDRGEEWWENFMGRHKEKIWIPGWPQQYSKKLGEKLVLVYGKEVQFLNLYCQTCKLRPASHPVEFAHLPQCPDCGTIEGLSRNIEWVAGIISADQNAESASADLSISLWDDAKHQAIPAEVDEIVICDGVSDQEWAISAVVGALQNHRGLHAKGFFLRLEDGVVLSENSKRILKPLIRNLEILDPKAEELTPLTR